MFLFQSPQESEDVEDENELVATAVVSTAAKMIQIESEGDNPYRRYSDQNNVAQDTFTHTSRQNDDFPQTDFIAQLQSTALSSVVTATILKSRLRICLERILVNIGSAKERKAGDIQNDGHCKCIGETPNI